jgi:hypothetical protein
MSLNKEDKKDVAKHMGKALANKVSEVTRDKFGSVTHIRGKKVGGSGFGFNRKGNSKIEKY